MVAHIHDAFSWMGYRQMWVSQHQVTHPQHKALADAACGMIHRICFLRQMLGLQTP